MKYLYTLLTVFILLGCDGETLYKQTMQTRANIANLEKYTKIIDNNITISYYENHIRSNKTLVFLHGYGDNKDTWLEIAMAVRNKYHMILIDLPGYGESTKDMSLNYSLENQVNWVKHFLDTFKSNNYVLIGNSMGGGIAVKYASKYPLSNLILISALGVSNQLSYFDLLSVDERATYYNNQCSVEKLDKLNRLLMTNIPYAPYSVKEYLISQRCKDEQLLKKEGSGHIYDAQTLQVINTLDDEAASIKVPTLILWGKDDKMLNIENSNLYHSLISKSTLIQYNHVGHVPMREIPYRTSFDILSFLSAVD